MKSLHLCYSKWCLKACEYRFVASARVKSECHETHSCVITQLLIEVETRDIFPWKNKQLQIYPNCTLERNASILVRNLSQNAFFTPMNIANVLSWDVVHDLLNQGQDCSLCYISGTLYCNEMPLLDLCSLPGGPGPQRPWKVTVCMQISSSFNRGFFSPLWVEICMLS